MNYNFYFRNFLIWLGLVPVGILNGAARQYIYSHYISELTAHQISTFTGISLFRGFIWLTNRKWPFGSRITAIKTGISRISLTIILEFLFGHYALGNPGKVLFHDYKITEGRL